MTTNPREIIIQVGQWCEKQPWAQGDKHAPDFGLIEEFGEFMHAVLKNHQGIRGFDDPLKFAGAIQDAVGDMFVYLCHWCYLNKAYFAVYEDTPRVWEIRPLINHILIDIHRIVELSHQETLNGFPVPEPQACAAASRLATNLNLLAYLYEFDGLQALITTWDKVKQRDWNKDKAAGGEVPA